MDRRKSPSRAAFTLVEVLIAILIIGILMALLVPTIAGAFRRAKEAQVSAELNNLATALASFKNTYGDYPPSRIILSEEGFTATLARTEFTSNSVIPGADSNDSDITYPQLAQRSLLYLRKFWPRVDFSGTTHDFNNDGQVGSYFVLSGSECLTYFLGGQPINNGNGTYGLNGFSKLPTNPFAAASTNRTVPNYEFNTGRLVDQDGDNIPSYLDPIDVTPGNRRSYAYFCSYGTNSYDPNDVNGYGHKYDPTNAANDYEYEDDLTTDVERGFTVGFPPGYVVSPSPNPYTSGPPVPSTGTVAWINPNSFQLICAGQDRFWGLGGTYAGNNTGGTGKLPIYPKTATAPAPSDSGNIHGDNATGVRNRENDNLTNFASGRLD